MFLVPSGFPSAVLQKIQDIYELSSETSSSLSVCLGLFSRQEGVSLRFPGTDSRPALTRWQLLFRYTADYQGYDHRSLCGHVELDFVSARCISVEFSMASGPLNISIQPTNRDFPVCHPQIYRNVFLNIERNTIKKSWLFGKWRHSWLLRVKSGSSGVILSCQMDLLCQWFMDFNYTGRVRWVDYVPAASARNCNVCGSRLHTVFTWCVTQTKIEFCFSAQETLEAPFSSC